MCRCWSEKYHSEFSFSSTFVMFPSGQSIFYWSLWIKSVERKGPQLVCVPPRFICHSTEQRRHQPESSRRGVCIFGHIKLSSVLDLVALPSPFLSLGSRALKIGHFILQRGGDLLQSDGQLFALGGRVVLQRWDDLWMPRQETEICTVYLMISRKKSASCRSTHIPHRSICWHTGKAGAMQPGYSTYLYESGER